ncbi:hypothetical protein TNCT_243431 [Trichonephila clavata]|uniref:Uncharacterized protein n=1 Tax=Trichonephila clavata TaxID=2740835 RepID=A0A8X6LAD1_TRICU|nr:hypothetical protein TNCT_243431 [Trichonephila clavata]
MLLRWQRYEYERCLAEIEGRYGCWQRESKGASLAFAWIIEMTLIKTNSDWSLRQIASHTIIPCCLDVQRMTQINHRFLAMLLQHTCAIIILIKTKGD